VSARSAEAAIRQFWPDHVTCLGKHDPVEDVTEGIVCPCGTILGFPQEDEPVEGPLADGTPLPNRPEPTGDWVGPTTDDPPWDTTDQTDPADWPAQAAEDAVVAEQTAAVSPEPLKYGAVSSVEAEDPITSALVVIDPTMPYGPGELESQLIDIAARLERGVHFQRGWEEQNYRDRLKFELAYNQAIMESDESSADRRKAGAIVACKELFEAKALSDMMVRAVRETMHNLRSLQSGYQTISNSIKSTTQSYIR
jgi:hypothetical protein